METFLRFRAEGGELVTSALCQNVFARAVITSQGAAARAADVTAAATGVIDTLSEGHDVAPNVQLDSILGRVDAMDALVTQLQVGYPSTNLLRL